MTYVSKDVIMKPTTSQANFKVQNKKGIVGNQGRN